MDGISCLACGIAFILAILAIFITIYIRKLDYWKNRGVPYIEPTIPLGNLSNPFGQKITLHHQARQWYEHISNLGYKHGGVFLLSEPVYVPTDLDYVKNIMAKDFSYFTDRGLYYNEVSDPLSGHLFALGGSKWRNLRVKLTPTFTSGKMKMMFQVVEQCGQKFKELVDELVDAKDPIDIKDVSGRFTTDVIGSCSFGLECQSIHDKDSPFRVYPKKLFQRSPIRMLMLSFAITYRNFCKAIGMKVFPTDLTNFFMNLVKTTVGYREEHNVRRNDFLQILIDLKNNELKDVDSQEHDGKKLSIEEVAAQCFVFFVAGFETSSTLMNFVLLELSRNQIMQDKVREEINIVLKHHEGQITYEALAELKYMQQVIDEALRLYPPVGLVTRECVKDYKIPDTDIVIEKGIRALISILGIHHDARYYPDPEKFDPERFSEDNKAKIPHYAYIPFGEGPRICIGMRFGIMQAKIGLTTLLSNFKFHLHSKTKLPIKLETNSGISAVEGGVWLKAERLG